MKFDFVLLYCLMSLKAYSIRPISTYMYIDLHVLSFYLTCIGLIFKEITLHALHVHL